MYKLIVFDVDGTLLDTEKAILCSLQKLLKEEKNISYTTDELLFVLGIPGHKTLARLHAADIEHAMDKWNRNLRGYAGYIRLFPQIEETVKYLQTSGVKSGIVTSKTKTEYEADFVPFGLHAFFDFVVCADDTLNHKPDPEPLLKCLEMASLLPQEVIYIGDTEYDMQCAKSAGVDFGLALWGTKNRNIESRYKFSEPGEILSIVDHCSQSFNKAQ